MSPAPSPASATGRLLLDTHVFLWAIAADPRLSARAQTAYEEGQLLLSVASIWEIVTKYQLGRLELPAPPSQFLPQQIERNAIAILPIRARHALRLEKLPLHHKDPYDRLLVAQSLEEELTLVTNDPLLLAYEGVSSIW
jgi:PIN domain nuclease of toxin-antitoxin system